MTWTDEQQAMLLEAIGELTACLGRCEALSEADRAEAQPALAAALAAVGAVDATRRGALDEARMALFGALQGIGSCLLCHPDRGLAELRLTLEALAKVARLVELVESEGKGG